MIRLLGVYESLHAQLTSGSLLIIVSSRQSSERVQGRLPFS
jgi:hypothetical protein